MKHQERGHEGGLEDCANRGAMQWLDMGLLEHWADIVQNQAGGALVYQQLLAAAAAVRVGQALHRLRVLAWVDADRADGRVREGV